MTLLTLLLGAWVATLLASLILVILMIRAVKRLQ